MRRISGPIAALVLLVVTGATLAAGPGAVQESSSVSLVEVPVTVLGKDDKPVRGLKAEDFEIRDDGKTVAIQSVDVNEFRLSAQRAPADTSESSLPAARRRLLFLFDLSSGSAREIHRAQEAAIDLVSQKLAAQDLGAVATFSIEHGLALVLSFTSDRSQILAALQSLGLHKSEELSPDPLQLTRLLNVPDPQSWGQGDSAGQVGSKELLAELREYSDRVNRQDEAYRRTRVSTILQSFGSLAGALNSVQGRKLVILFSRGFDMSLLQGSQDTRQMRANAENAANGETWKVDSESRYGSTGLQSRLDGILTLLRRNDCVIHAIDLSGLGEAGKSGDRGGRDSLFALTSGTGGETLKNANDFSAQLDRLLEMQSLVYVLTFSPRLTGQPDRFHPLKVSVKRPGTRVSARAGYMEPKPFNAMSAVEAKLTAGDVMAAEIPQTAIPLQVLATVFPGKERATVPVIVRIPGLSHAVGQGNLPLEIYVYAFDARGTVADFFSRRSSLDLARVGETFRSEGLTLVESMRLPPGEYRLRTLVRNGQTGEMGSEAFTLQVPGTAAEPSVSKPLFMLEQPPGIYFEAGSVKAGNPSASPFLVGMKPFFPDLQPDLDPTATVKLCLYGFNLGGPNGAELVKIGGEVLDAGGQPEGKADVILASRTLPNSDGRATYILRFRPGGLASGSYRLRVDVTDTNTGKTLPVETRFSVRAGGRAS
jgi:VWFA-related protein